MYCFQGIVAEDDLKAGVISPSYVQCKKQATSGTRSEWFVSKQTEKNTEKPPNKVLVTSLLGNDDMIDFLSCYRTRDFAHGDPRKSHEKTMKYYPKGGMFWFECDRFGEQNGAAVFIMHVPVRNKGTDQGFQRQRARRAFVPPINTVQAREPTCEVMQHTDVKPHLPQRRR